MALEELQNGRYRRLRLLGSGSMGEVYLMEDRRINRQVAIKVIRSEAGLHPDSDTARDAARLFQREARAIAALDHPNILPLYDFGEEDLNGASLTYMVMPFCPDGSFAEWLRQYGDSPLLSPQDMAYFVDQAADALQYAHDHHTLHLDVKPSNFLIRRSPKHPNRPSLLLADFGVAKLSATTSSYSLTVRGTPIAMAPEQWSGSPLPATDQYALAVMAYQLLVGRPPFLGGLQQVMYQHFHAQPQPPSTLNSRLSGGIDAVILRALAKRPEERYPSISAFASALGQAVQQVVPTEPAIRSQQPDDSDIRATLAISQAEALKRANLEEFASSTKPPVPVSDPASLREKLIPPMPPASELPPTVAAAISLIQESTVPAPPPLPVQVVPGILSSGRGIIPLRSRPSKGRIILLVGLALLLIASGVGLYSLVHANQTATTNATATGTANAHATATMAAFNATITALANPTSTPAPNPAATATALEILYNQTTSRTPTLDDPLRDDSKGYGWEEGANGTGGNCAFAGGAYHVSESNTNYAQSCFGPYFSNFLFEVQMKIIKGDAGGICFRAATTNNSSYYFVIGQDGSYQLIAYDTVGTGSNTLASGTSSAIKPGVNQTNLIAVLAQGSTIGLYVNHQLIDNVDDNTSSSGQLGVVAELINHNPTEVLYSNAKAWAL